METAQTKAIDDVLASVQVMSQRLDRMRDRMTNEEKEAWRELKRDVVDNVERLRELM